MAPKKTGGKYPRYKKPAGAKPRVRRADVAYTPSWKHRLKKIILRTILIGGALVIAALLWVSSTLPNIESLNKFTKAPSIVIKAEDGQIIGGFGDIYGDYVPFSELPNSLIDAVIATEDRNYYYHFGVDPIGLLRATFVNLRARHVVQGGSTITQQVAKNVFLTPERSFGRKLREMLLAIKLEQRYTKEDILSIYLNRVYLGAGNYGVDSASKRYFGKSARDLSLGESAILAGMLKAPSRYAPTSNPALAKKRADQVLVNMEDADFLTKKQTERARAELATAMEKRTRSPQSNLYFADWILDELPNYVGNLEEDIVVTTTLRPEMQVLADKAISEVMDKEAEKLNVKQAALLAMSPDGAVRAMIGGRSYAESQFNRTYQSLRQPGSSFKLFVYLAGLESGLTPDTLMNDEPITIDAGVTGKWSPKNYTGKYLGEIPLREAVAQSVNTVAVQVSEHAGLGQVVDMARRLGITSQLDALHSIALGAVEVNLLELTGAYAHLAANGQIVHPYGIVSIETSRGKPVYKHPSVNEGVVLRPDVVGMMNDLLSGVVSATGTGGRASIGRSAAGKTGTTSDYKDAWFIGYTPDMVTGVWVGNDDNAPMKKVTGGNLPAMIWKGFMAPALKDVPARALYISGPSSSGLSTLPWQSNITAAPESAGGLGIPENSAPYVPPPPIAPSFWDRVLSDDAPAEKKQAPQKKTGQIEYRYPTQKQ
ncbi:MAG: PBP1A family penicillin-binding protein [Alphaproteobacteria bacterium]|nr:PBP1A family penicillin-binding protein [Alphaproteobacteria bacterium]